MDTHTHTHTRAAAVHQNVNETVNKISIELRFTLNQFTLTCGQTTKKEGREERGVQLHTHKVLHVCVHMDLYI